MEKLPNNSYIEKAITILEFAREQMVKSVHHAMVFAHYELGRIIIEEEQEGKEIAKYAKKTIANLSKKLKQKYGRGYSVRNL